MGSRTLHYDGNIWDFIHTSVTYELNSVWGTSGDNVFAVGNYGSILHYDGSNWNSMWSGYDSYLHGVWCSPNSDAFAVGNAGTILHSQYKIIHIRCQD